MQTLISSNESTYLRYENIEGPLAGRRVRRREVMMDMRGYTSELLAKLVHQGALDAELTGDDKEQLIEYLVPRATSIRTTAPTRGRPRGVGRWISPARWNPDSGPKRWP